MLFSFSCTLVGAKVVVSLQESTPLPNCRVPSQRVALLGNSGVLTVS